MVLNGLDVSSHNGVIDWGKVKTSGIDFAMIRMGYGDDLTSQDDKLFQQNVEGCEKNGILWGAYLYSYALTIQEAQSELAHALRLLKGKKPSFPIAFDMEDSDGYKARHGFLSKDMLTNICMTFLDGIKANGYFPVLYANRDWLTNKLNDPRLSQYDVWLAEWTTTQHTPLYKGKYQIWQHTSTGKIDGISGSVDLNISYSLYGYVEKPAPIPVPKPIITTPTKQFYHVKKGDNLTKIANIHKTTIANLMILNPQIKNPNLIFTGQQIRIK